MFEAIKAEQPDLILIGGDMLVAKNDVRYQEALDFVSRLPQLCPVYYASGNHEPVSYTHLDVYKRQQPAQFK